MNIEDDLNASPTKLRAELRRLRSWLPEEIQKQAILYESAEEVNRFEVLDVMRRFLCPLPEGYACACPGACDTKAEQVLNALNESGYRVTLALPGSKAPE